MQQAKKKKSYLPLIAIFYEKELLEIKPFNLVHRYKDI